MDIQIVQWFQTLGSGFMDVVFGLFYYLINPLYFMPLLIALYYALDKELAYRTGVFYGVASFFCGTLKQIFKRPRPYVEFPDKVTTRIESLAAGYSMPSGHAMGAVGAAYPAAAKYGYVGKGVKKRIWVICLAVFFVLMVGFSRVYMAGHYLTDVLAGWGFGLLIAAGLEAAFILLRDRVYLFGMLILPLMVLLICISPESDSCAVGLAFTAAVMIGGYLERRFVNLDINVVWWKRVIRVFIAVSGAFILGLAVVSKAFEGITGYAVNADEVAVGAKTFGYFMMFFMANAWAFIACPFLFKYVPRLFKGKAKSEPQ